MAIVLRSSKLDPLTHAELDGNFEFLDDKVSTIETTLTDYVEVPSGVSVGDTLYWGGTEWAVTSTLNADTVTNGVYTTGNQTIGGVKTFTSTINGSITGTAPQLQTPRKINGTDFDGSANINTAYWGTSRLISIGGTQKTVNGSSNVTWSSAEIHAGTSGTADVAKATQYSLTVNGTPWNGSSPLSISTGSGYDGSDAVKLSGNQTIYGTKTFNSTISGNISGSAGYAAQAGSTVGTLTINGTSFNGASNVSMTLSDANAVTLNTEQTITATKIHAASILAQNFLIGGGASAGTFGSLTGGGAFQSFPDKAVLTGPGANMIMTTLATVNGNMSVTGNVTAYASDERLKDRTGNITDALERVDQIDTFFYKLNDLAKNLGLDGDQVEVGVSAQSVEKVLPEVVSLAPIDRDEDGKSKSGEEYKTVDYGRLTALLIEALKEIKTRIELIESKVN